ncbi:hypothetical protein C1645_831923 [Glomus cerebriforme]|uniref:DUF659 domain-containing protein n=1 Tax=Glomus cerebriforme TaxID=658196 RepID=A0A397SJ41_9GLOM|nr:hypothetical protein C1645_831923 [Glomus cerebriforme]
MNEDIMNQHNLTLDLHIAKYLAMQIEKVIKKVGLEWILAIVSDNTANVRKARIIINKKYIKIENVYKLNKRITETLAEADNTGKEKDNIFKDNLSQPVRRIINGEIIPNDNIIVMIKKVWIKNKIDLSNNLILKNIGNIPKDLDKDFINNEENNNKNISLTDDETVNDINNKGILNYNIDDLLDEYVNEH